MGRVSREDTSPIVVECKRCSHREYAEVQVTPPWHPSDEVAPSDSEQVETVKQSRQRYFPCGMPVSVGDPDEETTIIHFGCVVLGGVVILLLVVVVWLVF